MRYISTNNLTITSYASRRIFFSRVLHRKKTDSCAPHVFINRPTMVSNFCFNLYFSSDSTTHSWKVRQKSKNKDGKYVRLGLDGMVGGGALGWQIGNTIIAANITNYSGTHWPGKHAGDMFGKKNPQRQTFHLSWNDSGISHCKSSCFFMHHANAMLYTLHSWVYVRYNFNFGQQSILSALGKGAINHAVMYVTTFTWWIWWTLWLGGPGKHNQVPLPTAAGLGTWLSKQGWNTYIALDLS